MPDDTSAPLQSPWTQAAIDRVRAGDFSNVSRSDVQEILRVSEALGGDHFGISDAAWNRLEDAAKPPVEPPPVVDPPGVGYSDADLAQHAKDENARLENKRMEQWAMEQYEKYLRSPQVSPVPTPVELPQSAQSGSSYDDGHNFDWRAQNAPQAAPPVDPAQEERDRVIQDVLAPAAPASQSLDAEVAGAEMISTHHREPLASAMQGGREAASHGGSSRKVLVVGGGLLAVLILTTVVVGVGLLRQSKQTSSSTGGPAVRSAAPSAAAKPTQASAMISGIAQGGYNPDFVSCTLRGTVPGMVFHGTLSGPNIGSHPFVVTAGQASNGRTPTYPTDGIFALQFPGQGPTGPFTCTLTSVDVPSGTTLAPHQPGDWTLTVD